MQYNPPSPVWDRDLSAPAAVPCSFVLHATVTLTYAMPIDLSRAALPCRRPLWRPLQRLAWLMLLMLAAGGCVRRRLTVRTDPPGAMVYIDQQEIGVTPVSTSYTYYGTRNFVVTKDGFETVTASRTFHPPWYELPPIDFIVENLWPFEVRDERVVDLRLVPKQTVATDKLIRRGQDLRQSAAQGHAAPLPSCVDNPIPPTNGQLFEGPP